MYRDRVLEMEKIPIERDVGMLSIEVTMQTLAEDWSTCQRWWETPPIITSSQKRSVIDQLRLSISIYFLFLLFLHY